MIERKMGYRGSKSDSKISVKEQRVDGSRYFNPRFKYLRYTLMGFERNYPVKILSNQTNIFRRNYSIYTHKPHEVKLSLMDPWFITGFSDAESSFSILIQHNVKHNTNWRVKVIFAIALHKKDKLLLENLQNYWGRGKLHVHGKNSVQYRVESIKDLQVIIDHFDMYPLLTCKLADYILFKKAFNIIKDKHHLTEKGLFLLIGIKSSLNLGLNTELKQAFPNWEGYKVNRPDLVSRSIPNPNWLAGFSSGDSSFDIKISNSPSTKSGKRVQLRFSIGLNIREIDFIKNLLNYFKLNQVEGKSSYIYYGNNFVSLQVIKFSDIRDIIIPFFNKYPIQGVKEKDFSNFVIVADMINKNEHLTLFGFNKISQIKAFMTEERT